jgi:hypothetical protein
MKRLLIILLFCPIALGLKAQKVDLDKVFFAYNYRNMPSIVLDKSYTTYSIDITKSAALNAYSNESSSSKINIEGKKKVSSGGHIQVNLNLGDLIIASSEVKERVEINKDKDGKETSRSYFYKVEVVYSFTASAEAKDYKGASLAHWSLAVPTDKKTWNSDEYSKQKDAADYYNNNKLEIKTRLIDEQINAALTSLNSSCNAAFAYQTSSSREKLWDLGSKKHPEFANYTQATASAIAALKLITANEIPAQVLKDIKPAIEYFTELPNNYTKDEKGDKKIRYGAYFNLATIYLFTEQFDKAKEFARKLADNDYDAKDGEDLFKEADKIAAQLAKHQLTSRHFAIDVSNAEPPK